MNHNLDLDFSKFQTPPIKKRMLFAIQFFEGEQYQLERVTVVAFQKMRDVGDRAEYLLELEYENCNMNNLFVVEIPEVDAPLMT